MDSAAVENLAHRFIQVWKVGHIHLIDELAASDLVVSYPHFPEPLHGPEAFKDMLQHTHHAFPDLTIAVDDILAETDRAVVAWRYQGTHQAGELFGVEPSGQSVEVTGMTRYHMADGRVLRETGIVDNLSLMRQLGAEPSS